MLSNALSRGSKTSQRDEPSFRATSSITLSSRSDSLFPFQSLSANATTRSSRDTFGRFHDAWVTESLANSG